MRLWIKRREGGHNGGIIYHFEQINLYCVNPAQRGRDESEREREQESETERVRERRLIAATDQQRGARGKNLNLSYVFEYFFCSLCIFKPA